MSSGNTESNAGKRPALAALALGALGVVFGDIGIRRLRTLEAVLELACRVIRAEGNL